MSTPIMSGAEPLSITGGSYGVLLLHGYTGTPQNVQYLAQAFARAGFAVEVPLLPGHGTSLEELAATRWSDYARAAEASYEELALRCQLVVIAGLSQGATLAAWVALRHPEIAGLIAINGIFQPPPGINREVVQQVLKKGMHFVPADDAGVSDPQAHVLAYDQIPLVPMPSLLEALDEMVPRLGEIRCPVLVFTSLQDKTASPESSRPLSEGVAGPVEQVMLERSYHVATLDYDKELIAAHAVDFVEAVTGN